MLNLGFAAPVTLSLLQDLLPGKLPSGYNFAPSAAWVRELLCRGHRVTLYSLSREISEPLTVKGESLTVRLAPWRKQGTGRDRFRLERACLRRLMAEDGCELIHAHWTYEFALAALDTGLPTLVTIHDLPWRVLATFRDAHRAARLLMAYEVAWRGKHFTAVSEDAARHFRRYLKPGAKIDVVPNGMPDATFDIAKTHARRGAGPVFATVLQGWSRRKNPMAALRAFQQVRAIRPEARLLMFGQDFEAGGTAQRWAREQGMEGGVTFAGAMDYEALLPRISEEVDVVVHPSLDEALSMTALESLALRKPFLAGKDTPGMRQILDDGRAGVLVDASDPMSIAAAMLRLASDEDLRRNIAAAGYQRVQHEFRLKGVMDRYENLYCEMLRAPRGAHSTPR
ncbi:MAG: glycosyltransferase family 4 protein [Acidobacteriota bacterium]|nr:glycosyltransferase family 4 protein [Acidobacteriota bacterium]